MESKTPKRRPNGAASVHQRRDGRWVASRRYVDETGEGRRRYAYGYTRAEALNKISAPQVQVVVGSGFVYFMQARTGEIKIGFSQDVHQRRRTLATASAHSLTLLGTLEGTRDLEATLHRYFADLRLEGEWFQPAPRLLDFVASLAPASIASTA